MNSKKRNILLIAIPVFLLLMGFILTFLLQQVKMNDGTATGNSAGNLNNGGLFCELDGVVYFSNAYDNGCLYSMNPDESNMKKLSGTGGVSSINADSNYLYYYMDSFELESFSYTGKPGPGFMQRIYGVYRSRLNGKSAECLKRANAITVKLCGNYLYFQYFDNNSRKGTQLYKIKIDKKEENLVADYNINPASCFDGAIYFNGTENDHYLYALNTADDSIRLLWNGDVWNPVYDSGYIYYMDISHNYRLCRYSMADGSVQALTDERIDFFNIYGDTVYYQKSSKTEPALKRMYTDGSNAEVIASGVYKNINITSRYVYFTGFDSDTPVYRTPVNGPVDVAPFDAAAQAVIALK